MTCWCAVPSITRADHPICYYFKNTVPKVEITRDKRTMYVSEVPMNKPLELGNMCMDKVLRMGYTESDVDLAYSVPRTDTVHTFMTLLGKRKMTTCCNVGEHTISSLRYGLLPDKDATVVKSKTRRIGLNKRTVHT